MREDIKINDRALALEDQIIEVLEKVYDTDVELDVYNLGLIMRFIQMRLAFVQLS